MTIINDPDLPTFKCTVNSTANRTVPPSWTDAVYDMVGMTDAGEIAQTMKPGRLTIKWFEGYNGEKRVIVFMTL